jgi:hypothetical protein
MRAEGERVQMIYHLVEEMPLERAQVEERVAQNQV